MLPILGPIIGGLIAGIGSVASGIITTKSNTDIADKNRSFSDSWNKANLNERRIERAERRNELLEMRQREDTAVQRRAADMEAAGINPLMAGMGMGAQSGQMGGIGGSIGPTMGPGGGNAGSFPDIGNSIVAGAKAGPEMERMRAEVRSEEAKAALTEASEILAEKQAELTGAQRAEVEKAIETMAKRLDIMDDEARKAAYDANIAKIGVETAIAQAKSAKAAATIDEFRAKNPRITQMVENAGGWKGPLGQVLSEVVESMSSPVEEPGKEAYKPGGPPPKHWYR